MKIDWYRIPVTRDRLKELTRRSDAWGLVQAGSFLTPFKSRWLNEFFY